VHGTENLVRVSVTAGVRRFVFTSSASVYKWTPWPFMWPITENFPLKTPGGSHDLEDYAQSKSEAEDAILRFHHYAQSKLEAEDVILRFHRQHKLEYVILRPTEVYGPPKPGVEQFIKQVINHPAQVLSPAAYVTPMQWVHVSDAAEAVVRAGTLPQAANHVFNIAGSELFAWPALIAIIWKIIGRGSWLEPFPYQVRTRGNSGLKYDFSKAQRLLGYTPKVKLQEGLQDLVAMISNRTSHADNLWWRDIVFPYLDEAWS
jgi:nucleoside-diphosphate-sugar epimerase